MYYHDMKQAGFFTAKECRTIEQYINLSDVLITYSNGVFTISTREETHKIKGKAAFVEYVKADLYWIMDALKAMHEDREEDGRQADREY